MVFRAGLKEYLIVFRARYCDSNTRDFARIPKSVKKHIHIYYASLDWAIPVFGSEYPNTVISYHSVLNF